MENLDLEVNDTVRVKVNSRAKEHLGVRSFEAKVRNAFGSSITFEPIDQLQENQSTHTWYSDIGYIHGMHESLERYTDIGKVISVEVID